MKKNPFEKFNEGVKKEAGKVKADAKKMAGKLKKKPAKKA